MFLAGAPWLALELRFLILKPTFQAGKLHLRHGTWDLRLPYYSIMY
jgi:hypothetical protein